MAKTRVALVSLVASLAAATTLCSTDSQCSSGVCFDNKICVDCSSALDCKPDHQCFPVLGNPALGGACQALPSNIEYLMCSVDRNWPVNGTPFQIQSSSSLGCLGYTDLNSEAVQPCVAGSQTQAFSYNYTGFDYNLRTSVPTNIFGVAHTGVPLAGDMATIVPFSGNAYIIELAKESQIREPPLFDIHFESMERERELALASSSSSSRLRSKSIEVLRDVVASVTQPLPASLLAALDNSPSSSLGKSPRETLVNKETNDIAAQVLQALEANKPTPVSATSTCECTELFPPLDSSTPHLCLLCNEPIGPLKQALQSKRDAIDSLLITLRQLDEALQNDKDQSTEAAALLARVEDLSVLIDSLDEESERFDANLELLNEKHKDEVLKTADLERDRDALQAELDELTVSLMEEANVLVKSETQQRHVLEEREKLLEQQLNETRETLKREQVQLRELKIKMEKEYSSMLASESAASLTSKLPPLDELLFREFKEFVHAAPNTKQVKLATLAFMKNLIEDDIIPTLRFGGNPRTSTRKFLDAVSAHLVTAKEMTPLQYSNWIHVNQSIRDAITIRAHVTNEAKAVAAAAAAAAPPALPEPHPASSMYPLYAAPFVHRGRTNSSEPIPNLPTISPETSAAIATIANISVTPSHAVFQKSMVERVSLWSTTSTASTPPTSTTATSNSSDKPTADPLTSFPAFFVLDGCSTCGKHGAPIQHHFHISDPSAPTPSSAVTTGATPSGTGDLWEGTWIPICESCYDRVSAVVRLYEFVRVLRTGVYAGREVGDMYAEYVEQLRKELAEFKAQQLDLQREVIALQGQVQSLKSQRDELREVQGELLAAQDTQESANTLLLAVFAYVDRKFEGSLPLASKNLLLNTVVGVFEICSGMGWHLGEQGRQYLPSLAPLGYSAYNNIGQAGVIFNDFVWQRRRPFLSVGCGTGTFEQALVTGTNYQRDYK
ncbi:hypothetical protein HDU98_007308, partial [Podochytrium sp. JEL0797]